MLQAPGNWLNYNRYAYCLNNPLKYTDPSGYYTEDKLPCAADYYTNHENFYSATHYGSFDPGTGSMAGGTYVMNEYGYLRQTANASQTIDAVFRAYWANGGKPYNYVQGPSQQISNADYNNGLSNNYTGTLTTATQTVVTAHKVFVMPNVQESGFFGDILTGTDKHFNGSLGTIGVAVQGYRNIPNDIKRAYAYKLSKMTGIKSGQIFQGAKGFANSTGKLVSRLGPVGTALGIGVIGYEVGTDTWDAHTIVNGSLMIGAGAATLFAAPAVLTGIAIYGVGDYFFDFGGIIDRNAGRNSGVWRP